MGCEMGAYAGGGKMKGARKRRIKNELKADIASERFGQEILALLARAGKRRTLVETPDNS